MFGYKSFLKSKDIFANLLGSCIESSVSYCVQNGRKAEKRKSNRFSDKKNNNFIDTVEAQKYSDIKT